MDDFLSGKYGGYVQQDIATLGAEGAGNMWTSHAPADAGAEMMRRRIGEDANLGRGGEGNGWSMKTGETPAAQSSWYDNLFGGLF